MSLQVAGDPVGSRWAEPPPRHQEPRSSLLGSLVDAMHMIMKVTPTSQIVWSQVLCTLAIFWGCGQRNVLEFCQPKPKLAEIEIGRSQNWPMSNKWCLLFFLLLYFFLFFFFFHFFFLFFLSVFSFHSSVLLFIHCLLFLIPILLLFVFVPKTIFPEMKETVSISPRCNLLYTPFRARLTAPARHGQTHTPRCTQLECPHPRQLRGGVPGVRGQQRERLRM